jgi:hypothetical protein
LRAGHNIASGAGEVSPAGCSRKEFSMFDILMVPIALGFFALSVAYVFACDEL